ncbi:hypothetical protein M430DRAFT_193008 [Amorphotheca resinae ATCC 22711]|uniref:Uncharacterized protein n=1 Tax=Amorphotheca resinae ATCC 22711 TaxID=857342 RepID=A0A2T3AQ27_AMORE|nr:hypothetical protein M430DRAFT_193008 [Amorphotheca resinae ATCC 22711]PSS07110.1 hypothetical protein M430DRAFT_193008 [Amorphotheca resinae ATCC 22711]
MYIAFSSSSLGANFPVRLLLLYLMYPRFPQLGRDHLCKLGRDHLCIPICGTYLVTLQVYCPPSSRLRSGDMNRKSVFSWRS